MAHPGKVELSLSVTAALSCVWLTLSIAFLPNDGFHKHWCKCNRNVQNFKMLNGFAHPDNQKFSTIGG